MTDPTTDTTADEQLPEPTTPAEQIAQDLQDDYYAEAYGEH